MEEQGEIVMNGRVKSVTNGKSIIGVTVLIRAEHYIPIDLRKLVEIKQLNELSK